MDWCRRHFIVTTLVLLVFLALIVAVTLKVFFAPVDIPNGTAAAFATFFALPAITVGLLKWRAGRVREADSKDRGP